MRLERKRAAAAEVAEDVAVEETEGGVVAAEVATIKTEVVSKIRAENLLSTSMLGT